MRFKTYLRLLLLLMLPADPAMSALPPEEAQKSTSSGNEVVVTRISEHDKVASPTTDPGPGQAPGSESRTSTVLTRPFKPARGLEDCRLPELTIEILDPATDRAVIREGSNPPQVVKPGSVLASSSLVLRQIGVDKLVAFGDVGNGGVRPVWWIFTAEKPGERSRVQCFVAATSPSPAPRPETTEPTSPP